MRNTLPIVLIIVSLTFIFLLSSFSNILAGYQIPSSPTDNPQEPTPTDTDDEALVALFKVTPLSPQLYWRIWSADYYTGRSWLRTTNETILDELPLVRDTDPTRTFKVEINLTQSEFFLPLPSSQATFESASFSANAALGLTMDAMGQTYKLKQYGLTQMLLTYNVSWNDVDVEDKLISVGNVSNDVLDKYLQLPYISLAVRKIAQDLEDPSYSVLDQILADVQYLRTNFIYDSATPPERVYGEISQGSDVASYLDGKKGVCIDAATALAVILRIQKIPARISVGFKPGGIEEGKLVYYTKGAHALTEAFLPPYGWVQFDATPPLQDNPLVRVSPFKKEGPPGNELFYQVSVTNRLSSIGRFRLFVDNEQEWSAQAAPEELRIEAGQTADAVLEVKVPGAASFGEKNTLRLTAYSIEHADVAFHVIAIVQVENTTAISTTTTIRGVDGPLIRRGNFWANGTVHDSDNIGVNNMTIFVFLTKGSKAEGVIAGKGYSEQGEFRIECSVPSFLEIGDYRVTLLSLGTAEHAPSSEESSVKVAARTNIELGPEKEFLLGYGAIHASLSWDNGTGLANALVSVRITSITKQTEARKLDSLTSKDGTFRIETAFQDAGAYEVHAVFSGDEYTLGSNVTSIVNMRRGQPEILISAEKVAVRGEAFTISGKAQSEGVGVWGEPLTVALDQQPLATVETIENGTFSYTFLLNAEQELGAHVIVASLSRGNETAVHDVAVKSKTNLTTKISNVANGMFLLFSASLSDDHNLPIQGAGIIVDNYGLSSETDENGILTVLLDNVNFWPGNSTLTARFEGSELYLPVRAEKGITFEQWSNLPITVPLIAPGLIILVISYGKHILRKRKAPQRASLTKATEERVVEAKQTMPQEPQLLQIALPHIATQFPPVWGVNEQLRAEIVLDESLLERTENKEVRISIDTGKEIPIVLSRPGRAEYSCVFIEKGEHKIRASFSETPEHLALSTEVRLRIVDYEEEILRLYDEFLRKLSGQGIDIRKEMTAREIEYLILSESNLDADSMREVTTCFEKIEYSNHLATRKDYEILYLSLKELGINIE